MKYHEIRGYRSGTGTDGHNGGVYADSECVSEINTGQKILSQSFVWYEYDMFGKSGSDLHLRSTYPEQYPCLAMSAGKGGRREGTNRWRREEIVTITGETERMERQGQRKRKRG